MSETLPPLAQREDFDPSEGNPLVTKAGSQYRARTAEDRANDYTSATEETAGKQGIMQMIGDGIKESPKLFTVAAAATIAAGAYFAAEHGGNASGPENAEVSDKIYSVTLGEGAMLRFDPYVIDSPKGNDIPNGILRLNEEGTVTAVGKTQVFEESANGTWYGLKTDFVLDGLFSQLSTDQIAALRADKDGVVWVNEQGVSSVQLIEDTIPSPDTK